MKNNPETPKHNPENKECPWNSQKVKRLPEAKEFHPCVCPEPPAEHDTNNTSCHAYKYHGGMSCAKRPDCNGECSCPPKPEAVEKPNVTP